MIFLVVLVWIAFGVDVIVVLCLSIYLELRIHALVQSGDLPVSTPRLFIKGRWGNSRPALMVLFSRRFAEIDGHTRRLTPLLRAAFVVLIPLVGLVWVLRA